MPLSGEPEDLIHSEGEPHLIHTDFRKFACNFQTSHTSFSCTHMKLSILVYKTSINIYKDRTFPVKLTVF
jgi:hypothetical protein